MGTKELIQHWARGMYDIFTNAKREDVEEEIYDLLDSLNLIDRSVTEYWWNKYD